MKIRMLKDGSGYSECNSPDELVGKGRCNHILESGNKDIDENNESKNINKIQQKDLELKRTGRAMYHAEIKDDIEDEEESKQEILSFVEKLPSIGKEKERNIINILAKI